VPFIFSLACTQQHAAKAPPATKTPPATKAPPVASVTPNDALQPVNVIWTQLVNASVTGTTLTKSGGQANSADASAISQQTIASGDGWLEFTVDDALPYRFVGLGRAASSISVTAIDFAFRLQAGRADAYERGAWKADNTVVNGDVLRVSVESGVVKLYKNGSAFYTSATAPAYPLVAAAALVDSGATVAGARLGLPAAVTPSDFLSNVSATPSSDGTSAVISWTSSVPADGQVHYGTSTSYDTWSTWASVAVTSHSITLTGLATNTTYHFSVHSIDASGNIAAFPEGSFTTGGGSVVTANGHHICGWLLATGYTTPDQDPGYLDFAAHATDFDAVHPMWWHITAYNTFGSVYGEGSSLVLGNTTAGGKRTLLIPTIAGADGNEPSIISAALHDAGQRAAHEAAIVNLVTTHNYDGIDLDYEHLPDGDRAVFSQFASELGAQLHALHKTLSFAVGALTSATSYWDYDALSQSCDQLHVMGYDYHFLGSHPGPVAPLGWIRSVVGYIGSIGRPQKFILGLPNYGLAGPDSGTTTWFGSSMDAINLAGSYDVTTTHMASCPFTNGATVDPGRAPNAAATAKGHLFFDDLASLEEKVAVAQAGKLGGITYWTIGGEPDRPGPSDFFTMVRSYFPH
jgi:spore germination protein YaaH